MNETLRNADTFELTSWQKKQAAMLYFYSSEQYLATLHKMVRDLVNGLVDPMLDLARAQGRDSVLINSVWGARDTSENWANNGWPILKELQTSLARTIARRTAHYYDVSAVNECLRGIDEYSLGWMTPGEETAFNFALRTISTYARRWDLTVNDYESAWDDFLFAYHYPEFASITSKTPKFTVRRDTLVESGDVPSRTGVYFAADDPQASLQFAWTEHGGVKLRLAKTFNDLGLAALAAVGRDALWFDEDKMLRFVLSDPLAQGIRQDVFSGGEPAPSLAPSAVGRSAFTTRACSWMLVEPIPGEFEELGSLSIETKDPAPIVNPIQGGHACTEAGFYFTPSAPNSRRYFAKGDQMSIVSSGYGDTIWQLDVDQSS
jgi:hypothetical protein